MTNGLISQVAAVRAARERLGSDLDTLNEELREQIGLKVEKTAWKIAATAAAVGSGIAVRKLLTAIWRKARYGTNPPHNPAALGTSWGEAVAWTMATAVGVGVARLVAERGAAAGWRMATGHLPPGLEDVNV